MKKITDEAWDRVIEKAYDIVNATEVEGDPMVEVYQCQMQEILDELEEEFGEQSQILDTRADYLDDPAERRKLYTRALKLARQERDHDEVKIVLESLRKLDEEMETNSTSGPGAGGRKHPSA